MDVARATSIMGCLFEDYSRFPGVVGRFATQTTLLSNIHRGAGVRNLAGQETEDYDAAFGTGGP